ncbi:hypothetical protein [Phenylobacterium aquaticum]|uniref:hypothetical protein n=1 Tax=Phenylobacterium aquaticum TaxID=1763816 RepID=UPI001F5E1FA0|nr:hypothetical protein [Phenylobacterium aquaticum]MCI3130921.1 hypothetical protein [Phenylobacterium aquaticum]
MTGPVTEADGDRGRSASTPGMPRWVKVFCVVVAGLIVLFVALHLAGLRPGGHGFHGRHAGAARTGAAA